MLSKNHPIILFIDRFGFSIYQDTLTSIPKFNFTPDLVSNLDVINKEQFASLISTFIQINKIVGSSLAVILSDNVIYIKDLVSLVQKPVLAQGLKTDSNDDKEHKDEVQGFLENIPFEEVLAKVIKAGNANRIVAVNKDLIMSIVDTFVGKGSTVEAVVPSFMYGQNVNFTTGLTSDNIRTILENTETLKSGNLLTDQERMIPSQNLENELKNLSTGIKPDLINETKKPRNLRQYLLIGIFIILLIILGVVYSTMGTSQTPSPKTQTKNTSRNMINSSTPPPVNETIKPTSAQTLITSAPLDFKGIKVKIVQNFQEDTRATNLKSELLKIGLIDISSEISEISIPEKSSAIFSQNIPADLRNNIIMEIREIFPDISILENQDFNSTVSILIGKS